ncbi:urease subunit beta [Photobacterium profundum]|uniref:urease subunit beta n=1 Tax=Photobacterium profundum TaxID=74109 RepID=UPI003D1017E4
MSNNLKETGKKTPIYSVLIPGELRVAEGNIKLNPGMPTQMISVANLGDRPIQLGSHYHFFEANDALDFDRILTKGYRLNIAAGTAVRFEPGQSRTVELVAFGGHRVVYGFQGKVMGSLDKDESSAASANKDVEE